MLKEDPADLLDRADRFRRLAPQLCDAEARETMLRLADECEVRAEILVSQALAAIDLTRRMELPASTASERGERPGLAPVKTPGESDRGL